MILCLLSVSRQVAHATCREYSSLIDNGGYGVADQYGNVLTSCNLNQNYIPASIVKILTALTALQVLGPAYRFSTKFYLDPMGVLYIKGDGEPLLISEQVEAISLRIRGMGIEEVNGVVVDNSAYDVTSMPPGSMASANPYDAPVAATSVNFNSLPIRVERGGVIRSNEEQTPYIPFMAEMGKGRSAGTHRVNICAGGCLSPQLMAAKYTGELFTVFLRRAGIRVNNAPGAGKLPDRVITPVYIHYSEKTLEELIKVMLYYSSNFIANQIFLTSGAAALGYPATWEKGVRVTMNYLGEEIGEEAVAGTVVVDGAGLSRENRMNVAVMLKVLDRFAPYADLLRTYRGVPTKTGTLDGVYNLAGYLDDHNPYVIMLNQGNNFRVRLLEELKRHHLRLAGRKGQPTEKNKNSR